MKRKTLIISSAIFILLVSILFTRNNFNNIIKNKPIEYLHITATTYNNGKNDDDGVSFVLYLYSIKDKNIELLIKTPVTAGYVTAFADVKNNKVYYSNSTKLYEADNLYEYDLKNDLIKQLTFGKFLFNDLFKIDNSLFVTSAPQYATVTQPAIFNLRTNKFTYLNPNDDDTWCYSLSYNYTTKKLLSLTTSDSIMRSNNVTAITHIRPKTLYMMDLDFENYKPIYETDQFEIRLTRQLDANRILMTTDPYMGSSEPRTLKILYIDSQKTENFDIPGIKEVKSFYPRDNMEGLFILGMDYDNNYGVFYYDLINESLINIFENYELPEDHRGIVDFVYSIS